MLGGCFEPEFALWSNHLIVAFREDRSVPVLSALLETEVRRAPTGVREIYAELLRLSPELVPNTTEALDLLAAYEGRAVLGPRYRGDILHIALATGAGVDRLVSWNFRHIVRFEKIRLLNAVSE